MSVVPACMLGMPWLHIADALCPALQAAHHSHRPRASSLAATNAAYPFSAPTPISTTPATEPSTTATPATEPSTKTKPCATTSPSSTTAQPSTAATQAQPSTAAAQAQPSTAATQAQPSTAATPAAAPPATHGKSGYTALPTASSAPLPSWAALTTSTSESQCVAAATAVCVCGRGLGGGAVPTPHSQNWCTNSATWHPLAAGWSVTWEDYDAQWQPPQVTDSSLLVRANAPASAACGGANGAGDNVHLIAYGWLHVDPTSLPLTVTFRASGTLAVERARLLGQPAAAGSLAIQHCERPRLPTLLLPCRHPGAG